MKKCLRFLVSLNLLIGLLSISGISATILSESFESPVLTTSPFYKDFNESDTVGVFTVGSASVVQSRNLTLSGVGMAHDGDQVVSFGKDGDGNYEVRIEAPLAGLTLGNQYQVSFRYANIAFAGHFGTINVRTDIDFDAEVDLFQVQVPDVGQGSVPIGVPGNPWLLRTLTFTATATTQTLGISGATFPLGPYLVIDSVNVQSIPEPNIKWLVALGGLFIMGKHFQKNYRT